MDKAFRRFLLVAAAVILTGFAPSAFADSTVTFNGSYSFGNNGYGIPPYGGTLNGQPAEFYCVDFSHDISGGMNWNAVVTPLTPGGNYGSTYLGTSGSPTYAGSNSQAANDYLVFAWILTQMGETTDKTQLAEDQWAIWSYTDGGYDPYGMANAEWIICQAEAAIAAGFNRGGWEILTPDSGNYGQEFMIQTPEPATLALLALGLGAIVFFQRRQARQH